MAKHGNMCSRLLLYAVQRMYGRHGKDGKRKTDSGKSLHEIFVSFVSFVPFVVLPDMRGDLGDKLD